VEALDGILNVNKPAGKTSYGVVARIRRLSGEKRVGHAGTLDPDATGVLPVCLGRATRLVEYLAGAAKTYRAAIVLGAATDTYDAAGAVTQRADPSGIDRAQAEAALAAFRGPIHQTPPMYSALKHKGQPLYKLARAGITVERPSRPVTVYRLEITDWQPPEVTLEVECSKGTYIRSLAHDLGQELGCGAYLKELARTAYGPFKIEDAVSLSQIEETFRSGDQVRLVHPPDYVLQGYPAAAVDGEGEKAIKQGNVLKLEIPSVPDVSAGTRCRAYAADGRFLGVLRYLPDKGTWQPEKVFI
jgi:tRNA pseudouridine55 synthase